MNKSESRYFATAAKMDDALLALLEKKDLAYITVKEICAAAGVNRSTFYLHYETVGDLLQESVERVNGQFLDHMEMDAERSVARLKTCPVDELYLVTPEYLGPYLGFIRDHQRLYQTVVENSGVLGLQGVYDQLYRHVIGPILDRYAVPVKDRRYLMAFYIQGLMAIIAEWLERGCDDPVERVISIIQSCVRTPGDARSRTLEDKK